MNLIAALPLFIWIVTVGNNRFLSESIDPLRYAEDRATIINGRFVDKTLKQNFLFFLWHNGAFNISWGGFLETSGRADPGFCSSPDRFLGWLSH